MQVLYVFNFYQNPGGEEEVFNTESALLERMGHRVHRYSLRNDAIDGMNPLRLAGNTVWNGRAHEEIRTIVRERRIDVVHFHNTFPLISPAAYYAVKREGAKVIQTLHNFRLLCPGTLLLRDGAVCEDCVGKAVPWPGVLHGCYRESRVQTAAVTTMLSLHRAAGTWDRQVDLYIALTQFSRDKFIEGGLPADKIVVKPNFTYPDPGAGRGQGGYALFVGRLAPGKGVEVMLRAWQQLGGRVPLKVVGSGPLFEHVRSAAGTGAGLTYLGQQPRESVRSLMKEATVLVFPSTWYEGFPMTIAESYACGLPVIASNLGSMASIVKDNVTGLHFKAGDAAGLAERVEWAFDYPAQLEALRRNARSEFLDVYSAERNYAQLIGIYTRACGEAAEVNPCTAAGETVVTH